MRDHLSRRHVLQGLGIGALGAMTADAHGLFGAAAQDDMARLEQLAKAAAGEGPVLWYETTANDVIAPCIQAFNKRFPNVAIDHVHAIGTGDMIARVLQESRAGGKSGDLISTTADQTWGISSRGLALEVDWKALGAPAKFVPDSSALIVSHSLFCIVYNTHLLTGADVPKGWDDMVNPKWKGKVGSPAFSHPYAGLVPAWGKEKTDAFMQKLVANEPVLTASTYTLAQQVASGELVMTVGLNWTALPSIRRGAPVKILLPDPLPVSTNYNVIPKSSKNVNGAKLLAMWLTTNEGNRTYEAATGRGNAFLDTEVAKLGLPTLSEFPISDIPVLTKHLENYNKMLKRGAPV